MKNLLDMILKIASNIAFDSAVNSVTEASAKGIYQPSAPEDLLSLFSKK